VQEKDYVTEVVKRGQGPAKSRLQATKKKKEYFHTRKKTRWILLEAATKNGGLNRPSEKTGLQNLEKKKGRSETAYN